MIVYAEPGERAAFESWIGTWRKELDFVSENEGCGCCADIWRVAGPEKAKRDVPEKLLCGLNEGW